MSPRFRSRVHEKTGGAVAEAEASRADRLEIENALDGTATEAERVRRRVTDHGPCGCLMLLTTVQENGGPSSVGSGMRVSEVQPQEVTITLSKPIQGQYAVFVQDQRPGSRLDYWVERKTADFFVLTATDLAGTPTDFTAIQHIFAVEVLRPLTVRF